MTALKAPLISEKLFLNPIDLAGERYVQEAGHEDKNCPRLWHLINGMA